MSPYTELQIRQFAKDVLNNPAFQLVMENLERQHISNIKNWRPDSTDDLVQLHREYHFGQIIKTRLEHLIS